MSFSQGLSQKFVSVFNQLKLSRKYLLNFHDSKNIFLPRQFSLNFAKQLEIILIGQYITYWKQGGKGEEKVSKKLVWILYVLSSQILSS
jgi:hypothetical protein